MMTAELVTDQSLTVAKVLQQRRPEFLALAMRRLGSVTLAEDALQDAFVCAQTFIRRGRKIDNPHAWLRTVVDREAVKAAQKRSRTVTCDPAEFAGSASVPSSPDPAEVVLEKSNPRLVADLPNALDALSPREREVFLARHGRDWSRQEIADHLGTSVGTVGAQDHQARARMRGRFASQHPGLSRTIGFVGLAVGATAAAALGFGDHAAQMASAFGRGPAERRDEERRRARVQELLGEIEEVLDGPRQVLGDDHPLIRDVLRRVARDLHEIGEHEQAERWEARAGGRAG